jgi:hypothetical protein
MKSIIKMTRKYKYLNLILVVAFIINTSEVSAQIDSVDVNPKVYWFFISVTQVQDSTGKDYYELKRKRKKIYNGVPKEFDRSLWKHIGNGSKIAIGPFNKLDNAKNALLLYGDNENNEELNSIINDDKIVYWIVFHVVRGRRTNYPYRKSCSIEYGNNKDFKRSLKEYLLKRSMTIGPFHSKQKAEEVTKFYRLY